MEMLSLKMDKSLQLHNLKEFQGPIKIGWGAEYCLQTVSFSTGSRSKMVRDCVWQSKASQCCLHVLDSHLNNAKPGMAQTSGVQQITYLTLHVNLHFSVQYVGLLDLK